MLKYKEHTMSQEVLFYSTYFPRDEKQLTLLEEFKKFRAVLGEPHRIVYLRSLLRTRPYTRTVYPPGWKFNMNFSERKYNLAAQFQTDKMTESE